MAAVMNALNTLKNPRTTKTLQSWQPQPNNDTAVIIPGEEAVFRNVEQWQTMTRDALNVGDGEINKLMLASRMLVLHMVMIEFASLRLGQNLGAVTGSQLETLVKLGTLCEWEGDGQTLPVATATRQKATKPTGRPARGQTGSSTVATAAQAIVDERLERVVAKDAGKGGHRAHVHVIVLELYAARKFGMYPVFRELNSLTT